MEPLLTYDNLTIFQNGRHLPALTFRDCKMCIIVQNFFLISQTIAEILQFFDFLKMAAIRHLGFVTLLYARLDKPQ